MKYMHVYERVKSYVKQSGINQLELSRITNIPISSLNAMLNGKRKMYVDDLRTICFALNTLPEEFVITNSQSE